MLVIRLTRVGKKNQPAFRVVLTEKSNPVRGKFIEILGSCNPRLKTKALKSERIKYWLSKGAQASSTVHNLLVSEKIIEAKKVKAWRPKKKAQGTKEESVSAPATEAATEIEAPPAKEAKPETAKAEEVPVQKSE
ncbi:MAG: 30S ribosomal protein S16 [Candidatus Portnoybacteria bacterium]|jgi:small subunit ribosomal protein S16|nr:30S ribosomal protein S16 [Candidatus Portnoybacteria bacterium]